MDRVLGIKRISRQMALAYVPGDCHVCHQVNVKVRRLLCGHHNYCRMCADFEPRLVKGDFSCNKCSDGVTKRTADRRAAIDNFLSEKAGYDVIEDQTLADDISEPTDLEGNNSEWEYLLKPLPVAAKRHDIWGSRTGETKDLQPILRKSSYLHLTLPSAQQESSDSSPSPMQPTQIEGTVTQLLGNHKISKTNRLRDSEITKDKVGNYSSTESDISTKSLESVHGPGGHRKSWLVVTGRRTGSRFQPNPDELERCSSPCKSMRPRSAASWCDEVYPQTASQTELQAIRSEIGDIEGPGFSASNSRSASRDSVTSSEDDFWKNDPDDFWDSFV